MPQRRLTLALLAGLTLLVGVGIGVALGTGDDDGDDGEPKATAPAATEAPDEAAVEDAILRLVDAVDRGDGAEACDLLGRSGGTDADSCARDAGVDLEALSGVEEVSIGAIDVHGDGASARLEGGSRVELRRSGDRWRVVAIR